MDEKVKVKGYRPMRRIMHVARCLLVIVLLPVVFVFQVIVDMARPTKEVISDNAERVAELCRESVIYLRIAITGEASQRHAESIERFWKKKAESKVK